LVGSAGTDKPPPQQLVLIDFGSMGRLGLLPPPAQLLAVLQAALEMADLRGILLSGGWGALEDSHTAPSPPAASSQQLDRLRIVAASSLNAHDLLLAQCAAVLHHGGSGTIAAALAAGVPQVVMPLHFDQPYWAGRLADLGLTPPPLDSTLLRGSDASGGGGGGGGEGSGCQPAAVIAARLRQAVSSPEIQRACADVAAALQVR